MPSLVAAPATPLARYAALSALLAIFSGAIVTSTGSGVLAHDVISATCALLVMVFALRQRGIIALSAVVLVALDAAIILPGLKVVHAVLAQAVFALLVYAASSKSEPPPELARLRQYALLTPPLVLLQTALGAAYRHKDTGVLPHMAGAMVVVLISLLLCVLILQRETVTSPLRTAAVTLISTALVQITLGIAAFLMRLLDADQSPLFAWVTVAHVTNGAVTLGASVLLALQFAMVPVRSR